MCNASKFEKLYTTLQSGDIENFNPQLSITKFFTDEQKEVDGAVDRLANHIAQTLQSIQDSNPKNLQKQNWLNRFLGKQLETELSFEIAKNQLNLSQDKGEVLYNQAKAIKNRQGTLLQSLEKDLAEVDLCIDVAHQFLADNQDLSMQDGYVDNKQRLDRKLESLSAMKLNLSMNIMQTKLSLLPITQVLDRYQETKSAVFAYKKHLSQYYSNSESLALKELEAHYNQVFGAKQ